MTVRRFDRGELASPRRLANGFLRVDAYLTRTGVFTYRRADGAEIREYRAPAEVFAQASLDSFDLLPVTNDHPTVGLLTPENTKQFAVGSAGALAREGDRVRGTLVITDAAGIAALEGGRQQISLGYVCDLDPTPGVSPEGERYDALQTNIVGNHVALVDVARAGPDVRVRMDSGDAVMLASTSTEGAKPAEKLMALRKIKLDTGAEIEIEDAAATLVELAAKAGAELIAAAKVEADKLTARADAADAKIKALELELSEAPAKALASAKVRAELEAKATEIGAEFKSDATDEQIKLAVIAKLSGETLDGKSSEYVSARFDAELSMAARSNSGLAAARAAVSAPGAKPSAHDDAMSKFNAALMGKRE